MIVKLNRFLAFSPSLQDPNLSIKGLMLAPESVLIVDEEAAARMIASGLARLDDPEASNSVAAPQGGV